VIPLLFLIALAKASMALPDGGKTVREVHVVTQNIFDTQKPDENKTLFRWADKLHIVTRPEVIERQVLLKPGDEYSAQAAAESERILRKNRYLYDAKIRAVPVDNGQVDLEVITRDVWTLQGGISFHRSGGANSTSFEIEDVNFLGTGKGISLSHGSSVDRTSNLFSYSYPSHFGTHSRFKLDYADNSDGSLESLTLERPFYSLDTRWALGLQASAEDRIDPLYNRGHVTDRFQHQEDLVGVYAGISPGLSDRHTHRWLVGFTLDRDRFADAPDFEPSASLPEDRTLAYPWVSYDYLQDGYFTSRDLDRLQRTEDVNTGRQFHLRLGYSSTAWGGTLDRVLIDSGASLGWKPTPRQLVLTSIQGGSRLGGSGTENLLVGGSVLYYVRDFGDNLLYMGVSADVAHELDSERQLLLGGDNGLRGYPLRYLQGDHRFLFTVEQRFFSSREFFHLLHLGAAAFFDAGSAWFEDGEGKVATQRELLRDIGLGLRFGSSRSARGTLVHLDLAFPLDGDRSIKNVQWLVSTSDTF
jgi:outer membrane protein assembly factor BamA